ncbi:MAG TPA: polysaccharide deacetylase family protein [Aquabacterium sp.]|nr:polysaccharide deacetylase family protein [Aquabacterium sp.]
MSTRCTVLMYHATPATPGELGAADPHYAVALPVFEQHLAALQALGHTARAVERVSAALTGGERPVGLTFDDGHRTNLQAARALAQRGWCATFFVNPSTVGTPDYLDWDALRTMAELGMSIQSHAQHHRYQDELSDEEQRRELVDSKTQIEQQVGRPVTVYAPPGGRTSPATVPLARQAGYQMVSTSRVGVWDLQRDPVWDVPRFAVLARTPLAQVRAWVQQAPLEVGRQVLRYRLLHWIKRQLGNGGYDRLRGVLLGTAKDPYQ